MSDFLKARLQKNTKELLFQIVLHVVLLLFYSFDKGKVEAHRWAFFTNYAIAAFVINYFLLPSYYYSKKYSHFFTYLLLIIGGAILIEELVLEQIYFPDTRGKHFSGVLNTFLDVTPVIIILSGFKFAWDAHKKQHEVNQLQESIKDSELQFLKSQINPHFLFNNLNNLYAYSIENSPKTPSIILELSAVLRYMLYDCKEDFVSLSDEVKHLKNFTALNELQIEDRGVIEFNANEVTGTYKIAPLILMVFVENAFKHSTASQSDEIYISIKARVDDKGKLFFECENSFLPKSNTARLSKGIGLENVKKRLALLYPESHSLVINQSNNRYLVQLTMQLTNL